MTQTEPGSPGFLRADEAEAFVRAHDGYKPFLASDHPERVAEFFSMDDFMRLVNQTNMWAPDRLEVLLDTKKVPPQNLYAQMPLFNGVRHRLQNAQLQKLLDRGASIVLNDIDSLTPGLKRLRVMVSDFTGGRVESNLYYSQPGHQAFSVHFDVHDVFAFQIAGEKRWRVYQQLCKHPINHLAFLSGDTSRHERQKGAVSMDVTLRPGDFLYLPAGYYHQAICVDKASAHLSFSSVEMIGLDVISEMFDRAVLDEFFRTPIARSLADGNRPLDEYLAALVRRIETLTGDDAFMRAVEAKLKGFRQPDDDVTFKKEWGA